MGEGGKKGMGGQALENHVTKLCSILRYAESSQGFTEIKQVSAHSIQVCRGSLNAWNAFVLRVEHPYIVRKLEETMNIGEPTFHAKLHVTDCSCKPIVHALVLAP